MSIKEYLVRLPKRAGILSSPFLFTSLDIFLSFNIEPGIYLGEDQKN